MATFEDAMEFPAFAYIEKLSLCETGEEAWFYYDAEPGEVVTFIADFAMEQGDIQLEIVDQYGDVLESSLGEHDDEIAWVEATEPGPLYARVWLESDDIGTQGIVFDLSAGACRDDEFEQNDVMEDAATKHVPVSSLGLSLCFPGEEDWFHLAGVQPGHLLDIRSTFNPIDGDLDLQLLSMDGEVLAEGTNRAMVETIVYWAEWDTDYLLRAWVAEDRKAPGMDYDVDVNVPPNPFCNTPDRAEGNDSFETAVPITTTLYEDFTLCDGESDFLKFAVQEGDLIDVWVDFTHAEGDVDLYLYLDDGTLLTESTSTTDDERIEWAAWATGEYVLEVALAEDLGSFGGQAYGLELKGPTLVPCIADWYEPNDTPETAFPRQNGDWLDQTICPGEDDWYVLELGVTEFVEINLGTNHPFEGNPDIYLMDEDLNVVAAGDNGFGNEYFTYSVPESGTYYLRVTLEYEEGYIEGQIYDFAVLALVTAACSPDVWEPNDSIGEAFPINKGPLNGATVCEFEPDFFRINAANGEFLELHLTFDPGEGDVEAYLHDPDGNEVAQSSPVDDGAELTHAIDNGGDWTIEIVLPVDEGEQTGNLYNFELWL